MNVYISHTHTYINYTHTQHANTYAYLYVSEQGEISASQKARLTLMEIFDKTSGLFQIPVKKKKKKDSFVYVKLSQNAFACVTLILGNVE